MMTPEQRIRSLVDRVNKAKAARPKLPTGGDQRSLAEAVNTGANARNLAQTNLKVGQVGATEPLAALIRKARESRTG
jgi:hypothetical protein